MLMIAMLVACAPEVNTVTRRYGELVGVGGTGRTFYTVLAEHTEEVSTTEFGYSSTEVVDRKSTVIRCDIGEEETVCGPVLGVQDAFAAAQGTIVIPRPGRESTGPGRCAELRSRIESLKKVGSTALPTLPPECSNE